MIDEHKLERMPLDVKIVFAGQISFPIPYELSYSGRLLT